MEIVGKGCVEYNVQYKALEQNHGVLMHNATILWISMHVANFQYRIHSKSVLIICWGELTIVRPEKADNASPSKVKLDVVHRY